MNRAETAAISEAWFVLKCQGKSLAETLGSDVHVWQMPLDAPVSESDVATLSSAELARSGRLVLERDRRRYLAAHVGLRRVLSAYSGRAPQALNIGETTKGKPYLADGGLAFNLSHSQDIGLVAVTAAGDVGVDIELVAPRADEMAIARGLFASGEIECLESLTGDARRLMFHRLWTCREAVLKAAGVGLPGEGLELGLDARGSIHVESLPAGREQPLKLSELRLGTNYLAAVAWSTRDPKAAVRLFDARQSLAGPSW
jgi:4'-phosphopantetheinyl transferase